jgi:hypothetical protein
MNAKPTHPAARAARRAAKRFDRLARFINACAVESDRPMEKIGRRLFRECFDGDPKIVASRDPRKMNSFRDLAARDDLAYGFPTLWRAVQVIVQDRELGTVASTQQFTWSHRDGARRAPRSRAQEGASYAVAVAEAGSAR